jgi:hypothetical protein
LIIFCSTSVTSASSSGACARGAQLDVAVLDRRLDQAERAVPALSPPFIALTSAALMSSRIIVLVSSQPEKREQ